VIKGTGAEATFCVEDGSYRIHTLVYDPEKLDLSGIIPDTTTAGEVLDLIAQTDTCAKLDTEGASFTVELCEDSCITDAGTLRPRIFPPDADSCYNGTDCVEIVAEVETEPVLQAGYEVLYVLTMGEELVIKGTGAEATFCVEDGSYRIHTLVYDPEKLDLSGIIPDTTRGGVGPYCANRYLCKAGYGRSKLYGRAL